jgi:hypothetical protein
LFKVPWIHLDVLLDSDAARVRALAAYKDFFTLWENAEPDVPILKQAKAEYAKLMGKQRCRRRERTLPARSSE